MTKKLISQAYFEGMKDCIMLIERGIDKGLSIEESFDSAKKAYKKTKREMK